MPHPPRRLLPLLVFFAVLFAALAGGVPLLASAPGASLSLLVLVGVGSIAGLLFSAAKYTDSVRTYDDNDIIAAAVAALATAMVAVAFHLPLGAPYSLRVAIFMSLEAAIFTWLAVFLAVRVLIRKHPWRQSWTAGGRLRSWAAGNVQYLFLLFLCVLLYGGFAIGSGIAPAGDMRAHIFRTLDFVPGLLSGDYTPIQYHGYAFLAGYGIAYYAFSSAIAAPISLFLQGFVSATVANNALWVLTPFALAVAAIALADELGMRNAAHRRIAQALLGTAVLLYPGVIQSNLFGADPYILSFAFSLLAFAFGMRAGSGRSWIGFMAFGALSVYTEPFGYIFVAVVFVALLAARKAVYRTIPALLVVTAFSWVQFLEMWGHMAPYIEETSLYVVSFPQYFGAVTLLVGAFVAFYLIRSRSDMAYRAVCVIVLFAFAMAAMSATRLSLGWSFGTLNGLTDGILPWRLVFINIPILLLIWVFARGFGARHLSSQKALALSIAFLLAVPAFLGMYTVSFSPMPSPGAYSQYSGSRMLVAGNPLSAGDSPIVYSPSFGYSTVTGAFSQGDPSFFLLTVYYEWAGYAANPTVGENLLHLTGSNELLTTWNGFGASTTGAPQMALNDSTQAVAVTPILVEAPNATEALQFSLFVNLLGKEGYTLDFVTSAPAHEVYGAVVLPGYEGSTAGIPTYTMGNATILGYAKELFPVAPYTDAPYLQLGKIPDAALSSASAMAASLISFFHPVYAPASYSAGQNWYSAETNTSLPIQLSRSYYPYFSPGNYSQNVYGFILLPGSERIAWHLPFYEAAALVSAVAAALCAVLKERALLPERRRKL